jgi:hypothetical protein
MKKLRNKPQLRIIIGNNTGIEDIPSKYSVDSDPYQTMLNVANDYLEESIYGDSEPGTLVAGIVEKKAGRRSFSLMDERGVNYELAEVGDQNSSKWADPQLRSDKSPSDESFAPQQEAGFRDRVNESSLSVESRLEAILEWASADMNAAAQFVLSELGNPATPTNWRNALVFAADAVRFDSSESRETVCTKLLQIARSMRGSQAQHHRPVVLCAIQRAGSMIPCSRVDELEDFLAPSGAIDTRLAALQTIVRIFEAVPPDNASLIAGISDRAATLAEKRWDVDVFAVGEISALAIEGTITIAALGDSRLGRLLDDAKSLGKSWVTRKLIRRLDEIREFRVNRGIEVSAFDEALAKLNDEGQRDASGSK